MTPSLITQLAFLSVVALSAAIFLVRYARQARAEDALRRRLGQLRTSEDDLVRHADDGDLVRLLAESGLGWTPGMFAVRASAAAAVGALAGAAVGSLLLAGALGAAGAATVWIVVRRARTRRLALCDEQMPQALEIMALALRAGHALPGALRLAAGEAPAPLCHELRRTVDEHGLGRSIGDVIASLGRRLPGCAAVHTFVVAAAVLDETGGNLIAVLERIVDSARARATYRARLRALTAEGRQSARLLALVPGAFALLAMASDPSYGRLLLGDPSGRAVLVISTALWLLGLLWTRRLVRPLS